MKVSFVRRVAASLLLILAGIATLPAVQAQSVAEGQKALDLEQFNKAGSIFRALVASAPTAEHHYYLGNYYLKINQADSALAMFDKGLSVDPKSALCLVGKGAYYMQMEQPMKAKPVIDEAMTLSKRKNADVLFAAASAYTYYKSTDPAAAVGFINAAIAINAKNVDYYILRGDAYLIMRDPGQAQNNFEREALRINPNSAKAYTRAGRVLERAKNYTDAAKKYREGISKDADYYPAYRELAEILILAGRNAEGLENYSKYYNMTDKSYISKLLYAEFLLRNKKYAEAVAILKELEAAKPDQTDIQRGLGYAYYETGDYANAVSAMQTFFSRNTDSTKLRATDYEYLGRTLIKSGKDTLGGIKALTNAARKDSSRIGALREFGGLMLQSKAYGPSAELFSYIVKNSKATGNDYFDLGRAYYYGKDFVSADTTFGSLIEKYPNFIRGPYWKAQVKSRLDPDTKLGYALPYYQKYVTIETETDKYKKYLLTAYNYIGSYFLFKGDKANADLAWNAMITLDATNAIAREGLAHDYTKKPAAPVKPAAPAKATKTAGKK